MTDDLDDDPDFLFDEEIAPVPRLVAPANRPRALVVEDDSELTRICTECLARIGIDADVVWTGEDAVKALSNAGDPLAFVYADARLVAGSCADAASAIRRLRPSTPFVVAGGPIEEVLSGDHVAILKPFDPEEFQAAFDASLFDAETRRLLLDAADAVRVGDAADRAALAALSPSDLAELQLSA